MPSDVRAADPLDSPTGTVPGRRPTVTEGRVVFVACVLAYLCVVWWFWRSHLIPGDSLSRVANAYYTLFSRDPHLAAVGFVWNPLPSLLLLPALPLKGLLPALTRDGLAAALSSALFMAGAVALVHDVLRRLGVPRAPRLGLTVVLAAHPMMLIYAGNGMSEAYFLFFLALAAWTLLAWLVRPGPERLVPVGLSLALAYADRYEALAPGLVVPAVVAAMSWWWERDRVARRWAMARTDAALAGLPVVLSVAGWAVASKMIVDQWFATFSSQYGNSAQVAAALHGIESVTGHTLDDKLGYALRQLLGLAPLVPLLLALAVALAVRRRDPRVLVPVAVFLPVLAFDNLTLLTGTSFGWLRFQITAVPLAVLLAGVVLAAPRAGGATARAAGPAGRGGGRRGQPAPAPSTRRYPWGRYRGGLAGVAVTVAVAVALPASVVTLHTPRLAREESEWLTEAGARRTVGLARLNTQIARDLDRMSLPEGAVVTDSAYAFAIILASRKPKQFVITSDRDFRRVLADPVGHRARYLLLSANGAADAVRAAHPWSGAGSPPARVWADEWGAVLWTLVPVSDG